MTTKLLVGHEQQGVSGLGQLCGRGREPDKFDQPLVLVGKSWEQGLDWTGLADVDVAETDPKLKLTHGPVYIKTECRGNTIYVNACV